MSETLEPARDADTGQFTPSNEGLYGREYENAKAGFTTRKDTPDGQATPDYGDADPVREAAAELTAKRGEPEVPITVADMLGELDPTEALTVKQAASEFSAARADIDTFTEGMDLAKYVDEIDQRRAEVVKGDKRVAEVLGLDDVPKDPALSKAEQAEAAEIDGMEGLDAETKKALKQPQIRAAIEQELGKAEQATQAYSQGTHSRMQPFLRLRPS